MDRDVFTEKEESLRGSVRKSVGEPEGEIVELRLVRRVVPAVIRGGSSWAG